jgi:alanyl-tRNA synthetase
MQTRAPADPDVREFEATVERVADGPTDGSAVVLDETYFYAESGGQPADRGTLAGVPVVDVRAEDGAVVHYRDPGDGSEKESGEAGLLVEDTHDDRLAVGRRQGVDSKVDLLRAVLGLGS